ncbi:MAG: General stress protein 69 [Planctomycetes bacterium ADurb.Bin126]|nr:MAG: General stress protein 69 [Planctomycetes bacterium ADurb.Bin126]HOD81418.1 aldo/keto reductase [Phycisphaerae bacterium]HQL74736.1 aldo/keto reductase [Phycisphaerae bacterium]
MTIARRDFLKGAVVGAGGLVLSAPLLAAEARKTWDPYETVTLGTCGVKTSRTGIGMGIHGWMRQSNHTRMGKEKAIPVFQGAFERGIRLFDGADLYGTHQMFAEAMAKVPRDKYTLVSKIWINPKGIPEEDRPDADVVVQRFLKELKTDYIDILQFHCQTQADWPKLHRRQMDIMDKLKDKGLIRAHGVSCHSIEALEAAAAEPWVDVVHARINHKGLMMDDTPEKVVPVLRKLHKAGKGVIGMKLVGNGKWKDAPAERDAAARFVLGLGCVTAQIVGFEAVEQIDEHAARVRAIART